MIEKWLNDVKLYENTSSDMLLSHFYRWITSLNSKFYDPVLHRMINKLMQKYFSIFIRKIKEYGFQIIYADYKKIFIFNGKTDINEFQANIDYLFRTIRKINIFNHITFTSNTFWKIILFKDNFNCTGIRETENENRPMIVSKWTISEFLPIILEKDLVSLISDYIIKLSKFIYLKDHILVMNLYEQYASEVHSEEDMKKFINQEGSVKEFKKFLIKNYISSKVFNMLPNIMKKKGDNYEDEERELNQINNDLEVEPDEEDDGRLFTKRDFIDDNANNSDDYDEEDYKTKQKSAQIRKNQLQQIKEHEKMWAFPDKLGAYQQHNNLSLEYIKVL